MCRRVVWIIALEKKGQDMSHIKTIPRDYRPNNIAYRPTMRPVPELVAVFDPIEESVYEPSILEGPAPMQCLENFHEKYEEFRARERAARAAESAPESAPEPMYLPDIHLPPVSVTDRLVVELPQPVVKPPSVPESLLKV